MAEWSLVSVSRVTSNKMHNEDEVVQKVPRYLKLTGGG